MNVLFGDYDQGIIGEHSITEYPTADDVRQAVCKSHFWGAIYANPGASSRLSSALVSPRGAEVYNNSQALTYVLNGAKYAAYAQTIYSSLEVLMQATKGAYSQINGTKVMAAINVTNSRIAQTLLDSISASSINIKPINQGVRFYYNTVSMVMPILQQIFFIMALNGIFAEHHILRFLSVKVGTTLRLGISVLYTFIASICMSGNIWAFREGWDVNGGQVALTWMAIWLVMHLNFLLIDSVTTVIPMKFMPFAILTWIIINVSSSLLPFDLSPGFYRVGYALPDHQLYQLLLDIWTDGCNPPLYRSLPILFSWWIIGFVAFLAGMRKRHNEEMSGETEKDLAEIPLTAV